MQHELRWLPRFLRPAKPVADDVAALYAERPYLDAYADHTDLRVDRNPHRAVGGLWEEMGQLQLDFLRGHGLRPEQTLLDIGCGTLRGGRRLIDYLDAGRYTGIDISRKALGYAAELVRSSGLLTKRPTLLLNEVKELTFVELAGARFDVLLAQSVFTHLRADNLRTCFAHLGQVLKPRSAFFFTYHERRGNAVLGPKSYGYPKSFFEDLAGPHDYRIDDLSHAYPHPRGQRMLRLTHA